MHKECFVWPVKNEPLVSQVLFPILKYGFKYFTFYAMQVMLFYARLGYLLRAPFHVWVVNPVMLTQTSSRVYRDFTYVALKESKQIL
jgi:uncharacterized protein with PQ loop repeat